MIRCSSRTMTMNTAEFLTQPSGVFKEFSPERLRELVDGSRVTSFESNEAIVHHGEEATHFGLILSGTVSVSVIGDGGTRQPLGRLQTGETFGEMSLITGDMILAAFIAESR